MSLSDWIDELRDMVRRRFWLIVRLTVLGCVAALLYALSQAHEYTSQAVLQVEDAKVADALAPPTVSGADARQLQIVEQRVMSHDAILDMAAEVGVLDELGGFAGQREGVGSAPVAERIGAWPRRGRAPRATGRFRWCG